MGSNQKASVVTLDRLASVGALLRKDDPSASDVHADSVISLGSCPNCKTKMARRVCGKCGHVNLETGKIASPLVKAAHSGAMVALYPPKGTARTLALTDGSEPAESIHLTLAYIPELPVSDDPLGDLAQIVRWWAENHPPIEGTVGGFGVFNPSTTSDDRPVTVALADLPALPDARQQLIRRLNGAGMPPSTLHGYVPHLTLDYADRGADLARPDSPLKFSYASVVQGARRIDVPFGGGATITVDAGATRSVPLAKVRPAKRFSFSPVYIPNRYDAHDEWTDPDQLQEAIWGLVKSTDTVTDARMLTLQHIEGFNIGEWVELACWPEPHEATLLVPGEPVRKVTLPANTPWMGVLWTPAAWREVQAGRLRGLSMEGTSLRTVADIPTLAA